MALGELTQRALKAHVDGWLRIALSTDRADRLACEREMRQAYQIVGLSPPSRFIWLDSPMSGAIAASLLAQIEKPEYERIWKKPQEFMISKFATKVDSNRDAWLEIQHNMNRSVLLGLRNGILLPITRQIARVSGANLVEVPRGAAMPGFGMLGPPVQPNRRTDIGISTQPFARAEFFIQGRPGGPTVPANAWNDALEAVRETFTEKQARSINQNVSFHVIFQQTRMCAFGSMDAPYLAFLDYCNLSGLPLKDIEGLVALAKHCGWWWPFKDVCIITERPTVLHVDSRGNLHSDSELAIQYADQWGAYALNGNVVNEKIAKFAGKMSVQTIESELNVEIRRQMIEMYGLEKFIKDARVREIQSDDCGVLYRKEMPGDEPVVVVKVINSTPEPDGSYREYFIRVPPTVTTAHAAVAWTFGLNPLEYNPEKQT